METQEGLTYYGFPSIILPLKTFPLNRILSHNAGLPPELVLPTDPSKVQVPHGMEHLCGVDFTRGGIFTEINEVLVKEGKENIYSEIGRASCRERV